MAASKQHIVIRGTGIISPLGHNQNVVNRAYASGNPAFTTIQHHGAPTPIAALPPEAEAALQALVKANPSYRQLDRSVLMAMYAARQAAEEAGWLTENKHTQDDLAVNIGSSRGATELFEQYYGEYTQSTNGNVQASASPTTTLGNLSSWVAHAVNAGGAQISHSITCSTALMAIANGAAWLKAGMAKRFLAGGTEAPLTPFTIAQMKAIGIYSKLANEPYPCMPYNCKQNTFVLGEGAAVFAMELVDEQDLKPGDIMVEAIGFGFEKIESKTGISSEGLNFQRAMRHALSQLPSDDKLVDLLITHTPGTKAGDKAELYAIDEVFRVTQVPVTTNKWMIGHTLGASGALSMQYAINLLKQTGSIGFNPTYFQKKSALKSTISSVMVNAAGFGGNAASVILKKIK